MAESDNDTEKLLKRFVSLNQRVQNALKSEDADNVPNFVFEFDRLLLESALIFNDSELPVIDAQMKLMATSYINKQPVKLLKAIADLLSRTDSIIGFSKSDTSSLPSQSDQGRYYITVGDNNKPARHPKKVFVVHGHDDAMKQSIARTLEQLGLEPVILHEQPDGGKTIIEKFERYSDVGFAVVSLSPDDLAYPKGSDPSKARPRARQNVILELGFFLGKLDRSMVCVIYREVEDFEMPSDYHGVLYIPFDKHDGWKSKLAKELKGAEYHIDLNKLT